MGRVACVNAAAFPLQLLLRDRPGWRDAPAAVVDRDAATGVIQWANALARRRHHIHPGMRYVSALSLCRDLCAAEMPVERMREAVDALLPRLWRFSPRVEPSLQEPGVFWLDASGLRTLFPSLTGWANAIQTDLHKETIKAVVVVGFSRFGSYAAAKARQRNAVFYDAAEEQRYVRSIAVERLEFQADVLDVFAKLGVQTLGQFMDLPAAAVRRRFGEEVHALHEMARGAGWNPLTPQSYMEPAEETVELAYPAEDREALLIEIEPALENVIAKLARRHERLASLCLALTSDDGGRVETRLAPAVPTEDAGQLLTLLRLRLETLTLSAGVIAFTVCGEGAPRREEQLSLFDGLPARNREAIHRAFAKLRAELGSRAVTYARLHERHSPEGGFSWEPMKTLPDAAPGVPDEAPLVRRFYACPRPAPPPPGTSLEGWCVAGPSEGPVEEVIGPHTLAGGWWTDSAIARNYYYVRTASGRWLWVYHDQKRRRWYLQGEVE